jgi:hypothetical protein
MPIKCTPTTTEGVMLTTHSTLISMLHHSVLSTTASALSQRVIHHSEDPIPPTK